MTMPQPPVPEHLRALARRQLDAEPSSRLRSLRKLLRQHAEAARRMQEVIIVRTKRPDATLFVDGGWANAGQWSLLLGEFDQAVNALRRAWQQAKDTEPAVRQVLATWRERHGLAPEQLFTEESEEVWLLLMPKLSEAVGSLPDLVQQAKQQWDAAVCRYLTMLRTTKAVDGPLAKADVLIASRSSTARKKAA